jgi:hypothetical protein
VTNNTPIKCPNCGHEFPIEDALSKQLDDRYKQEFQSKVSEIKTNYQSKEDQLKTKAASLKSKEETLRLSEMDMENKINELAKSKSKEIGRALKTEIEGNYKDKIQSLNQENNEKADKLKQLLKTEAENTKLKREMSSQKELLEAQFEKNYTDKLKIELDADRKRTKLALEEKIASEYNEEINSLKEENQSQVSKIKELNTARIENEKLKRKLDEQEQEIELKYEQRTNDEIRKKTIEIQRSESEKMELKIKDKDQLINSLKDKMDDMQRKAEQGSMERQGEAQEQALEEILKSIFIYDLIEDVPKGVKGADIIHTVRDNVGQDIGKIVYESKRTKSFSIPWIQKLKGDTVAVKGDISVIVSEALPEGIDRIGQLDGVWICSYHDLKGLVLALREGLIQVSKVQQSQSNQGDKMIMLYDYLTSNEFKLQIETIIDGFNSLQTGYLKEKKAMERIWKEREKQLERILINTNRFIGSIQGIAGSSIPQLQKIDEAGNLLG